MRRFETAGGVGNMMIADFQSSRGIEVPQGKEVQAQQVVQVLNELHTCRADSCVLDALWDAFSHSWGEVHTGEETLTDIQEGEQEEKRYCERGFCDPETCGHCNKE